MRVAGYQRFVVRKRHSWNIFGCYCCYCCLSNFNWNQLCWSFFFSKVAWMRVCNFFAKTVNGFRYSSKYASLSHELSTYYCNTDVCKDPNDYRSSRSEVFCKKEVLRNFAKFTGKHLCQSFFFNKVAGLQACNFILKNDSGTGLFLRILWNF